MKLCVPFKLPTGQTFRGYVLFEKSLYFFEDETWNTASVYFSLELILWLSNENN